MSMEGSLVRPQSAPGPCDKEQGSNSETESIPEWSLNVETYDLLQEGHCTYNAEEQSLVWPPMLLISSSADLPDKDIDYDLTWLRNTLAAEGVQAVSVAETKHICCEGDMCFHLFVLPPSGLAFAAAKAVDSLHGFDFDIFYPSLKDMIDIKNGRVPEFSRRVVEGLKYHGRPRQAWIDLAVDLVRDDGICVGRGVCQKYEAMDSVDEEVLGEFHVGVRVLEVLDDLLPSHWKGSLRRWRTTHVLYSGVSLFECSRQHIEDKSEDHFCEDGSDCANIAQAQGVLRDQCISSVFPLISISKDVNEFNHLSSTYATTCRNAIDDIEKNTLKSDSEGPSLHGGKSFATKFDIEESLRKDEIKKIAEDASMNRLWMKHLGVINSSHLARDAVKRLTVLQKLTAPAKGLSNMNARHFSTVDGLVLSKFTFMNNIRKTMKETESVQQWLAHHTAKATDEEKKKWEEQAAKVRMEEQKKWEERLAMARMEEQKKWEERLAKARMEEQKKWEDQAAKVMTELAVARQELADHKEAMPKCAVCFENLEGTVAKCDHKRSRIDVAQRKRACFTPCMHSSLCLDCAVSAWEKLKRCPVCSTSCSLKPQPIFM